jgi:hypothetical protein
VVAIDCGEIVMEHNFCFHKKKEKGFCFFFFFSCHKTWELYMTFYEVYCDKRHGSYWDIDGMDAMTHFVIGARPGPVTLACTSSFEVWVDNVWAGCGGSDHPTWRSGVC